MLCLSKNIFFRSDFQKFGLIRTKMQNKKKTTKVQKTTNKILILPIYICVEVIYYIGMRAGSENDFQLILVLFWITCSLVNTYFVVYALLPDYLKRSMKRKNIVLKILFYFAIVLIGFLITNGPVDKI